MAAQSGCVPCLAWLKALGQSLSEPAPASRGETPAMLAASKGQLAVLEWLQREGVDLWARDSQGKNVLDWARFRKQADVEQWLLGHRPPGP
jgi:ankyrin repeat protein